MIETNVIVAVSSIAGLGVLVGGLRGIDWLIGLKYQTKDKCNSCHGKVVQQITENRTAVAEEINRQYKDIITKIEHQTEIFQSLAKSVAEISAENKIILQNLGLKK